MSTPAPLNVESPAIRPRVNPWFIAAAVSIATFMEVLDTSIANVALRYIAGGISAAENDSEWIITSYLAANAAVLLISGWLSSYIGRRNYYLLSVAVFTAASAACGFASSLEQLVAFRILQGIGGGGLQPTTQAVLLDTFPPEKQGAAQTLFGISALLAPVLGPTLGGWLADNYSWRWIFFINIPTGLFALALNYYLLEDPDYIKTQSAAMRGRRLRFDYVGLGLIILAMVSWEVLLSKGQEWDWYNDPFRRFHMAFFGFVFGLAAMVIWEVWHPEPILNLAPFKDRNFVAAGVTCYVTYTILFATITLLPGMLQTLFGYNAVWSGLVMSPAGLFSIPTMVFVGFLLGRRVDARWLVIGGACLISVGSYWYSQMNLFVSPGQLIWPRVVQQLGTSCIFAPLSVAAYMYLPRELRGPAAGIFSVLRNEGGSAGTTLGRTITLRRSYFHSERLAEHVTPLNPNFNEASAPIESFFLQQTGDPAGSRLMSMDVVEGMRQQQSLGLAYFDAFWLFAVMAAAIIPLALLMRPSKAQAGEHAGME
jgi:DHA2 family multidrug resistance protein